RLGAHAERMLDALIRARPVPIERDGEILDSDLCHVYLSSENGIHALAVSAGARDCRAPRIAHRCARTRTPDRPRAPTVPTRGSSRRGRAMATCGPCLRARRTGAPWGTGPRSRPVRPVLRARA